MNKGKIAVAVINSIAALVCCVAIALGGSSITGKICENKEAIGSMSGGSSSSVDDFFADMGDDSSTQNSGGAVAVNGDATVAQQPTGDTSAVQGGATQTGANTATGTQEKVITATSGLSSSNKEEVLKYYQLIAAKNEKKIYTTKMSLKDLNGGSGAVGSFISFLKPVGEKALANNSSESEGIPGKPEDIKISDWKRAKAVNDGTYTTIVVQVVDQTDGANGKVNEGTVGRSISVLDGVQTALDEMGGVLSADFANAKDFRIVYKDAYFKIKVKNSTGEFVKGSCEWHHSVNVFMDGLTAKASIFSVTLNGASVVIDYKVTY